jgi:flagellar protein FlgJ
MLIAPAPMATPPAATREDIRKAAEGFEALFVATLLRGARAGLPGDGLTGSAALRQMTEMLDTELAGSAAARTGLGIAEAVARQFAGPEDRP